MHKNIYEAIDWARRQGFSAEEVLLRTFEGDILYWPSLDTGDLPSIRTECWDWA